MKIGNAIFAVILLCLGVLGTAQAGSLIIQLGDADGFNLGTLADETFPLSSVRPGDGDGTDKWFFGSKTFSLAYDSSELPTISGATLEVFAGGLGYLGIGALYFDDVYIGQLTDGDIDAIPNNYARLDIFDILPFSPSFDGTHYVSITTNSNDGWALDYLRLTLFFDAVIASIDIKPGDDPNDINLESKGKIPVAVLSTESFDASQVDWETVSFGPAGATESHGRAHIEDVDDDGDLDMVLHFNTRDTGIACGDTEATLTGETYDGQAISGTDSIVTVNCDWVDQAWLRN